MRSVEWTVLEKRRVGEGRTESRRNTEALPVRLCRPARGDAWALEAEKEDKAGKSQDWLKAKRSVDIHVAGRGGRTHGCGLRAAWAVLGAAMPASPQLAT